MASPLPKVKSKKSEKQTTMNVSDFRLMQGWVLETGVRTVSLDC